MHNLSIPVPPMLESAIGYDGEARYVAFYWMPAGDEAMYDDGRISGDGYWDAFLAFKQHPIVWPELRPYNLGNSDQEAEYWLLLDREAPRRLYIATPDEARAVLREQWPHETDIDLSTLTDEDWARIHANVQAALQEVWAQTTHTYSMEDAHRMLADRQQKVDELVGWLDQQSKRN